MAQHRRAHATAESEVTFKLSVFFGLIVVLVIGGLSGLAKFFVSPTGLMVLLGGFTLVFSVLWFAGRAIYRQVAMDRTRPTNLRPPGWTPPVFAHLRAAGNQWPAMSAAPFDIGAKASWNTAEIRRALSEIDWIQFERFCAVLLRAEGFAVIRQGGVQPDSGVDLIAEKDGQRNLVQCKHRHASALQEEVVREMSDRMTQFEVKRGTVFTLNGWTQPAAEFAASHGITLVDGSELGRRAAEQLPVKELNDVFNLTVHHCPKCDAPMAWREGRFQSFWGCSTFPRCRATLKHTGAR